MEMETQVQYKKSNDRNKYKEAQDQKKLHFKILLRIQWITYASDKQLLNADYTLMEFRVG